MNDNPGKKATRQLGVRSGSAGSSVSVQRYAVGDPRRTSASQQPLKSELKPVSKPKPKPKG